jgi:hypothetical protein
MGEGSVNAKAQSPLPGRKGAQVHRKSKHPSQPGFRFPALLALLFPRLGGPRSGLCAFAFKKSA